MHSRRSCNFITTTHSAYQILYVENSIVFVFFPMNGATILACFSHEIWNITHLKLICCLKSEVLLWDSWALKQTFLGVGAFLKRWPPDWYNNMKDFLLSSHEWYQHLVQVSTCWCLCFFTLVFISCFYMNAITKCWQVRYYSFMFLI